MLEVEGRNRAAALKGSMTYDFIQGNFLLLLLAIGTWAFGLGFGHRRWDLGLGNGIWASRLGFEGEGQRRRRRRKFPICVKA